MKLKQTILATAMLMAAAVPMQSQAATATATLQVTAAVIAPTATITTGGVVDFGSFLGTAATAAGTPSSFDVTVSNGIPYAIAMDTANAPVGNGSEFTMVDAVSGRGIDYQLFKDTAHTIVIFSPTRWGPGTQAWANEVGTGIAINYPVYAITNQVTQFGAAPLPAGTYTDTVTITVTY